MEAQKKDNQDYGIYFLLAVLCGVATACVVTGGHIGYILLGGLFGLLTAGFFVNVFVRPKDH